MRKDSLSYIFIFPVLCLAAMLSGCIKNNIPYPRIQANFVTLEASGQTGTTQIDTVNRVATITLPEDANIYSVRISGYSLTPGAHIVDNPFGNPVDLSEPIYVYLELYQSYLWSITAVQNIERYFEVSGQMGETAIDVPGHRVVVYVRSGTDLKEISVIRAKLASTAAAMTPDLLEGGTFDGSKPFTITTDTYGHKEVWTVYVQTVEEAVTTVSVDAWTCVAWVQGQGEAGLDNGFEYRITGSEAWTKLPESQVTHNGGAFTGCIMHLSPETSYEVRAYSDDNYGSILSFTTGKELQVPNSDFENWWLDKRVWCPWTEDGEPYWGTGNQGAATVGQSNTVPTDDTPTGTGRAAKLETKWIVVKLAAGNIFTGTYIRTDGTNGVLSFGRPFTERPVRVQGMYKYTGAIIDRASNEFKNLIGQPDTCSVWAALIDSDEPYEIRTNPNNRRLFDPDGHEVIAYGQLLNAETITSYVPFDFELKYKSTSRVPKYLIICASASKYGDYFTGGAGATMYIDDIKLVYDYK